MTDAVTSAVAVVQASAPQSQARNTVKLVTRRARWKDKRINGNVALEHTCIALALIVRWLAKVQRSRHVSRPVTVLATAVNEIHLLAVHFGTRGLFCSIVDNGTIGSHPRNGLEARSAIPLLGFAICF